MIIADKKNTVQRSGLKGHNKFKINATGKAFSILSSGLYTDKPKAIIRELSCNAYDAQIEAKVERPFDIHLPNRLEPFFKIRDYGVGLSRNDLETVYQTYFESTKTSSNEMVGCLGLGSKSPFSYTDSFEVISYFEGKKFTYSAYITEDETPDIALMSEGKTTEPNGLEISFPVKTNDFYSFTSKVPEIFRHFKVKPNFTGEQVEIPENEYAFNGTGWGLRESGSGSARAIMGNVSYPLSDFPNVDELDQASGAIIYSAMDIQFDIGDLEVTASRESLSYTKATKANIKLRLADIHKELAKSINKKFKAIPSLWEARLFVWDLIRGDMKSIGDIVAGMTFKWKGHEVKAEKYFSVEGMSDLEGLTISRFSYKASRRSWRATNTSVIQRTEVNRIEIDRTIRFFYNDVKTGSYIRCKETIHNNDDVEQVYLLQGDEAKIKGLAKKVATLIGIDEMEPVSVIERPKTASGRIKGGTFYNPKNARKVLVFERDESKHNYSVQSTYWATAKVDMDAGGFYLPINRYKVDGGDEVRGVISKLTQTMNSIGWDLDVPIVGAKASVEHMFQNHAGWIDIRTFVKDQLTSKIKNDKDLQDKLIQYETKRSGRSDLKGYSNELKVSTKGAFSKLRDYNEMLNSMTREDADMIGTLRSYIMEHRIELSDIIKGIEAAKEAYQKLRDDFTETYPLMQALEYWAANRTENAVAIAEYIELMDEKKRVDTNS